MPPRAAAEPAGHGQGPGPKPRQVERERERRPDPLSGARSDHGPQHAVAEPPHVPAGGAGLRSPLRKIVRVPIGGKRGCYEDRSSAPPKRLPATLSTARARRRTANPSSTSGPGGTITTGRAEDRGGDAWPGRPCDTRSGSMTTAPAAALVISTAGIRLHTIVGMVP